MQVTVTPSALSGSILVPASKSAMQRACAAALIKGGTTLLLNPGRSADDEAALDIIQQLGANVSRSVNHITVQSGGIAPVAESLHCGESGLSVRMFTSIAATAGQELHITGSGSLLKRPLLFFDEVFPPLGVLFQSNGGYVPLRVKGPLQPRNITVDGSLSSQYITGLLFAYAAAGASDVTISVQELNSKPYVDLTLHIMKHFGLKVPVNRDYREFYFDHTATPRASKKELAYAVESDWSSASFLLVGGAIAGPIEVRGLDLYSTQADKAILSALMDCGAGLSIEAEKITIQRSRLRAFHFNATHCPDLFPPLVALAAYCEGTTVIEGVDRLAHKESNRALTLQEEFGKLGITIELQGDLMMIKGGAVTGAPVHSRHDHRIAMACAIAGLNASGVTSIAEAEAINKSYPQFYEHLQELGAQLTINSTEE